MIQLNLPPFPARLEQRQGKPYIWDEWRNKMVRLTPEEWVRQHLMHYLVEHLGYPKQLLGTEIGLKVGTMSKRADALLYDRQLRPQMLIECKAPEVRLSDEVLMQAIRYNMALSVPYLLLSNGLEHVVYHIDYTEQSYHNLSEIPNYRQL